MGQTTSRFQKLVADLQKEIDLPPVYESFRQSWEQLGAADVIASLS